jgi:hypothetical protein
MDERHELQDRGAYEVIRRLEAYGDARLEPSAAATMRMRAAVMVGAHRQAALLAADAGGGTMSVAVDPGVAGGPRAALDLGTWRRPAIALLAGTLTLGILAGTAGAARPGGWLYQARIWTEAANLPITALPRAQAEVTRLQARLDEAQAAAATGDGPAVVAALEAYTAIVTEAAAGTGGDPAAAQAIELTLARHVEVLTALLATVPAPAQDAIQHALASSTKVLHDLDSMPPPPGNGGTGTGGGGGANPGNDVGGGANSDPGAGGNAAGDGTGGQKPVADPTPRPPKATPPGHDRSPRPTNDHGPDQPPEQTITQAPSSRR